MRHLFQIPTTAILLFGVGCSPPEQQPFDFAHAHAAIQYLEIPSDDALTALAATAGAAHLKRHSDVTGYYPPDASVLDISRDLVTNDKYLAVSRMDAVKKLLQGVMANREAQDYCLTEAKAYLPEGFSFAHPLYVTWGYDIGVSMAGSSSINIAHPHFAEDPEEIWFYCIHEMHHAGVMTFHPWAVPLADITMTGQLATFIRSATFLEGSAVYAAYAARAEAGALDADPDYVTLVDPSATTRALEDYATILATFEEAPERALTDDDWRLVDRLSDGERLWYVAGAAMAQRIDEDLGRAAYQRIIEDGSEAFFRAWRAGL